MILTEAIEILRQHNKWRRYNGPIGEGPEATEPKVLGDAIDCIVNPRWISVDEALPPVDEEVIVLSDDIHGKIVKGANHISYGHIVDKKGWVGTNVFTGKKTHHIPTDYNGWNIPGVTHWIPCPKILTKTKK